MKFGLVAAAAGDDKRGAFEALAKWLEANAAVSVELDTRSTYRALVESVREGSVDVAWLPPVVYAWLAEGVTPLGSIARSGASTYSSTLVTLESSKLETLADLRHVRAGWVDPLSAAGYVVPRIELERAGIRPSKAFRSEEFYGTHKDALLALARGDCDVAGTFEGAWSTLETVKVRVIATFGEIPSDVIAVRRNLPPHDYERMLDAFRKASSDDTARPLLRAVFGGETLREGIDPGHEALRLAFERATANGLFD